MKQFYLFLLLAFFSLNEISAQICPPGGRTYNSGTKIIFNYTAGTEFCVNRPSTITVEGRTFTRVACIDTLSEYDLTSGLALSGAEINEFNVTSGFATSCSYNNDGTLPIDEFDFLDATLKVYPNPLNKSEDLKIEFAFNTSAKVNVFDVTGKLIIDDSIENARLKSINISNLVSGLYVMKINIDSSTITRKLVVTH